MEMIVLRSSKPAPRDFVPVSTLSHDPGELTAEVVDLSPRELAGVRADPQVIGSAPPMPMHLIQPLDVAAAPASQAPEVSWGVQAVGASHSAYTGDGITVAVLDTGIDPEHPAFKDRGVAILARNFTNEPDDDLDGHGTHCAGTLFGRPTQGCRIGVAPGVSRALIGKVMSRSGGSSAAIYNAILWAYKNGARVISLSLAMDFPGLQERLTHELPGSLGDSLRRRLATSQALAGYLANVRLFDDLCRAIGGREGIMQGVIVVAAAGNESRRDIRPDCRIALAPPAAAEQILSVAALGRGADGAPGPFAVAPFSNTGARLSAPGVDIWSAGPGGGLAMKSGTSMAAPHVAGVAALWAEKLMRQGRSFRPAEVVDWVVRTALHLPDLDPDDVGLGLVQAP